MACFATTPLSLVMLLNLEGYDWSSDASNPPTTFKQQGYVVTSLMRTRGWAVYEKVFKRGCFDEFTCDFFSPLLLNNDTKDLNVLPVSTEYPPPCPPKLK